METKSMMGDGASPGTSHLIVPKSQAFTAPKDPEPEKLPISEVNSIKSAIGKPAPSEEIDLDHVQPLDPDAFPNAPEKEGNPVKATIANVQHLLRGYQISVSYDVVKKRMRTVLPGQAGSSDNASNVALTQILSLATLNKIAQVRSRRSSKPWPTEISTTRSPTGSW